MQRKNSQGNCKELNDITIHQAVDVYDYELIKKILEREPSCSNDWNERLETPLYGVYNYSDFNVQTSDRLLLIELLISHGADVNARSGIFYGAPMHYAAYANEESIMELLLRKGADPNLRDIEDNTALHYIQMHLCSVSTIKLLLQYGADPSARSCRDTEPLSDAAVANRLDIVKILKEAGAKTHGIYKALLFGCIYQNAEMVKYLITHAPELDARGSFTLKSAYFRVYRNRSMDLESRSFYDRVLLELGFDVNGLNHVGDEMTALHFAVKQENENEIIRLLKAGVNVNATNVYKDTALHDLLLKPRPWRARAKIERIAKLLVKYGTNVNAKDDIGFTPFNIGVCSYMTLANFLVTANTGIPINVPRRQLRSKMWAEVFSERQCQPEVLTVAVIVGCNHVVDTLLERRHKTVLEKDYFIHLYTPLYYAVKNKQYKIAEMLFDAGFRENKQYPGLTPTIDLETCDLDNLKLTCLLWEYDCKAIIKKSLAGILKKATEESRINMLTHILMFYYTIEWRSNNLSKEFFPVKGMFKVNESISTIFATCKSKLDKLEGEIVNENLSKFDMLSKKKDTLVRFFNGKANFEAIQKLKDSFVGKADLEFDEIVMKVRIELVFEKRILLNSAKNFLSECMSIPVGFGQEIVMPEEILLHILRYLNMRELKKFQIRDDNQQTKNN